MTACRDCLFYREPHCVRHAPVVVGMSDKVWSGWPLVKPDDWCAEHTRPAAASLANKEGKDA